MEQECPFCHRTIDFPVACGIQEVGDECLCCGLVLLAKNEEQPLAAEQNNGA